MLPSLQYASWKKKHRYLYLSSPSPPPLSSPAAYVQSTLSKFFGRFTRPHDLITLLPTASWRLSLECCLNKLFCPSLNYYDVANLFFFRYV